MAITTTKYRFSAARHILQGNYLLAPVLGMTLLLLATRASAQTTLIPAPNSANDSQPLNSTVQQTLSQQTTAAPSASAQTSMANNGMVLDQSLILGPGDLIDMQVFGTPELSPRLRVDQAGYIAVPFSGKVYVSGLTAAQAGAAIENALKNAKVMLNPHVTVFVQQYAGQGITVLGEVKTPGIYPLYGTRSLYEALAAAGGATTNEGETITISRRQDPAHPVTIPVTTPNFSVIQRTTQVQPGDLIMVSQAPRIYVVGEVSRPGTYYMSQGQNLKLLSIVAMVGGLGLEAATHKSAIIRPTPDGGAITIPIDLGLVLKNKAPNIALQASDVLVVPRSGAKVVRDLVLPNVTQSVIGAVSTALVLR